MTDLHRAWAERQLKAKRGRLAGHARWTPASPRCECGWMAQYNLSASALVRAHRQHKIGVLAERARRGEVGM